MKSLKLILLLILINQTLFGQAPNQFNYQAVVRNSAGQIIFNQNVGVRLSIVKSNASGTIIYSESHTAATNQYGLVNLSVGSGTILTGVFNAIDWGSDIYFLKVDIDVNGGTNYQFMGSSQLLSVPYSLYSKKAESTTETDPVFSNSVAGTISASDTSLWNNKLAVEIDGSVTNELQTLSKTGNTVTLSQNGGSFIDSVNVYTAGNGININNSNVVSVDLNSIFPAGMIVPFAGDSSKVPIGWLLCDGSAVSRSIYSNLFTVIGINYGYGNATTTFNLPDLRGRFLRGVDYGAGNDPDTASRTATNGGNSGNEVGSVQEDAFQGHKHRSTYSVSTGTITSCYRTGGQLDGTNNDFISDNIQSAAGFGTPRTSNETRPKNVSVNYIIKY